jgi:alpha-tubulin suppressor-like RCC1 family protein
LRALVLLTLVVGVFPLAATADSSRSEARRATVAATAIAAGQSDTCAMTSTGGVKCWGYNGDDQLGDGQTRDSYTPVSVFGLTSLVTTIAEGQRNACAILRGGAVKCWGAGYYGALGDGTTTRHSTPVDVTGLGTGVKAISAGSDDACAVTSSGAAKCWGDNLQGQLGDGTTTDRPTPGEVSGLSSGVTALASGIDLRTCAIAAGQALCWGRGRLKPVAVTGLSGELKAITTECALTTAGAVRCWGDPLSAADVPGLDHGVTAIASSGSHNCALMSTGGVKCWGLNDHGQLGDGTTTNSPAPVDVAGLAGAAIAIATGGFHTCAVLKSGGIQCWGSNGAGQLGDGTDVDRLHPVAVKGLSATAASVAIVSRTVHVTRKRVAPIALRCGAAARCRGTLVLSVGSTDFARAFSVQAGARGTASVKLTTSAYARLVRAKRLAARVSVTGGVTSAGKVTLVAP